MNSLIHLVTVAARICAMTADALVLVVTWRKTYAGLRMARQHNIKTPLATVLLRDGMSLLMWQCSPADDVHVFRHDVLCVSDIHH